VGRQTLLQLQRLLICTDDGFELWKNIIFTFDETLFTNRRHVIVMKLVVRQQKRQN